VSIGTPNAGTYTIDSSELGAILFVRETASNSGGSTVVWSARYVGPVISAAVASGVLDSGQVAVRNASGQPLATATFAPAKVQRNVVARVAAAPARSLIVRRARRVTGPLRAWACPVSSGPNGSPLPCSRTVTFRGARASLRVPAGSRGKVRIVVVRKRIG
jgi:hypothetical protein